MGNEKFQYLQIISEVGSARSKYIESIQEAKAGNYERCNILLQEGNEAYARGYRLHHEIMGKEVSDDPAVLSLLLVHAEDQLMNAESFKILCSEFLDVYRRFDQVKDLLEHKS